MEFNYLSSSAGLTRTYTLAYKLTDNSSELWSERFSRFKERDQKAYFGAARLIYAAFPPLLAALGLDGSDCAFACALSSSETTAASDRQVPYITTQLAIQVGAHEATAAITKQAHNRIHFLRGAAERKAELDKAQYTSAVLPAQNVFIFDDFVTRGDTLSRVAQAVLATNPGATVYGVALGKTERTAYDPRANNSHLPAGWNQIWANGEAEVA
ncbi:hypothetical protein EFD56_27940 [Rhizobium phaseoli]|uniref:phosphoribosyltransferase n=1 Tax=Rhizobium phaseoli TaxID=396 RepID=UPI000F89181D|nr:hypothetical protein [Rhizobium phaseoli]RUM13488.1 hypothetical protein EFD56_27940 [Rhizobium phaseoli]